MNISSFLTQYNLHDHSIVEFMGKPILKMPTSNPKFPNAYGAVRLSVMVRSLPCVLAFIASDGQTYDPTSVTDEQLEEILNHLKNQCRPEKEQDTTNG